MKKLFSVFLLVVSCTTGFSQTNAFIVTGKVLNAETKLPLSGASVFAQNTTLGTATDAQGNFKLWLPAGGYDIVITFTGYNTESKRISNADAQEKSMLFELSQKEKEMADVAVVATSEVKDGWEKYGSFFWKNLLARLLTVPGVH